MTSRFNRWEYLIEPADPPPDQDRLNALGGDGWELVAIDPSARYVFKRPAPSFRESITLDQRSAFDIEDER